MKKVIMFTSLFLILLVVGCTSNRKSFYRLDLGNSFNTISELQIIDEEKKIPVSKILKIQKDSETILVDLDKKFNVLERVNFNYLTDLKKVNNNAGISPVVVDSEVYDLVKYAHSFSLKEGYEDVFDISLGAVSFLWDFNKRIKEGITTIPTKEEIDDALLKTDQTKVIFNDLEKSIYLEEAGMALDLGAVVKGYAAQKIKEYLIEEKISSAVINIGRNIVLLGLNKGSKWNVKIQTPFVHIGHDGYFFGSITTSNKALVTSGVYEKYIKDNTDKIYHHLLNPKTGFSFDNGLLSVSIITEDSTYADIMSTFVFGLGLTEGFRFVEEDEALEAVFVYETEEEKQIYVSSGLIDDFIFNEDVSNLNYVYKGMMDYE